MVGRVAYRDAVEEVLTIRHSPSTAPPQPAGSMNGMYRLTGPMIVACQWNCKGKEILNVSILSISYPSHPSNNPTICGLWGGLLSAPRHDKAALGTERPTRTKKRRKRGNHTRSSPTGPAEQEDGGSLYNKRKNVSLSLV
jgi:hypothetical protein